MQNLKLLVKKLLLVTPLLKHILIFFKYKIIKTKIKIHDYQSDEIYMSKRNYAIYDKNNIGLVTGVDKNLNYEFAFSKKIIDFADKDKIFFDVGASYGHYTWLGSKLYKTVYAFEGDELALFYLRKNCDKFKNVQIINKYINIKFNLNDICKRLNIIPKIVKIDVEGDEIEIVKKIDYLLENSSCFLIEFHKRKILKKYQDLEVINEFFKTFEKYNYEVKFNYHHDYPELLTNGISAKDWVDKMPLINNFAIFAFPKENNLS